MRAILSEDADIPGSHAAGDMFLCSVLAVPVAARLRARVRLPAVGYNAVKSRLEAINAAGSSSPPTLVSKLFISGSVPEGMDQSELLGLLGSSHNYVQNLYMEPVKEVPTNWYLFTNGNSTLQSINLPQATKIGYNAFNKCTGLTSIDLPKVTEIGNRAFAGCTL